MVQELRQKTIRPYLCCKSAREKLIGQITDTLMNLSQEKKLAFHDFPDIVEHLRTMTLKLNQNDLEPKFQNPDLRKEVDYKVYLTGYHKKCNHHWRPLDMRRVALGQGMFKGFNTGGLLWGDKGTGKSQILAYLTSWAHENNWINFTIASCPEFVNCSTKIERWENGLYVQEDLAYRLLKDLKIQNE